MAVDREGVRLPRLRPVEVARRGVVFGLLGVVPLVLVTASISDHSDREEFLAVFSALAIFGALFLVTGAGFWWLSKEDIRRLRDWSTIITQADSVTIIGPIFLRSGCVSSFSGLLLSGCTTSWTPRLTTAGCTSRTRFVLDGPGHGKSPLPQGRGLTRVR
ncbi:DUF6336 family protein [Streptomyces werraensis]|nr:DUF6336 family protein [Streptomyces werraensis]